MREAEADHASLQVPKGQLSITKLCALRRVWNQMVWGAQAHHICDKGVPFVFEYIGDVLIIVLSTYFNKGAPLWTGAPYIQEEGVRVELH